MVKKYNKQHPTETHLHQIKTQIKLQSIIHVLFFLLFGGFLGLVVFVFVGFSQFEGTYRGKIYPGVRVDSVLFGGKTEKDVEDFFSLKSVPLQNLRFVLRYENLEATLSGSQLNISFDGKLSAAQAYSVGRSDYFLSNIYQKWMAATRRTNLTSVLKMDVDVIGDMLATLSAQINREPKDALFDF